MEEKHLITKLWLFFSFLFFFFPGSLLGHLKPSQPHPPGNKAIQLPKLTQTGLREVGKQTVFSAREQITQPSSACVTLY